MISDARDGVRDALRAPLGKLSILGRLILWVQMAFAFAFALYFLLGNVAAYLLLLLTHQRWDGGLALVGIAGGVLAGVIAARNAYPRFADDGDDSHGSARFAYIRALRTSVMSLYEVSEIEPGTGFLARDLIRGGDAVRILERSASQSLKTWDRIGARVVTVGSKQLLSGGVLSFNIEASNTLIAALTDAPGKRRSRMKPAFDDETLRALPATSRHVLVAAVTLAMIARAGANPTEIARRGFEQVVRTGSSSRSMVAVSTSLFPAR